MPGGKISLKCYERKFYNACLIKKTSFCEKFFYPTHAF